MVGHGRGGTLAAAAQRTLMIIQPGIAPGRFRMPQEENGLHHANPVKSFENKRLLNCHDTVIVSGYRLAMDAVTSTPSPASTLEIAPDNPRRFINRELSW